MWLQFDQVSIGYPGGPPVLREISFRVGAGLWLLTGPNGSGKSSLLRCAAGILRPRSGRLLWNGDDAWERPSRYRWHLGYAPQDLHDLPDLTVQQYLGYLGSLKGVRPQFLTDRTREVAALAGLADGPLAALSTGMKRRLGLAAALLNDPDLLILDEPTAGLDIEEKLTLRMLLSDLAEERVLLVATHLPEELAESAAGHLRVRNGGVTIDADRDRTTEQNLSRGRQGPR